MYHLQLILCFDCIFVGVFEHFQLNLNFLLEEMDFTKVKQVDTIQDWINIQLENGTLGWIQSSSIKTLD